MPPTHSLLGTTTTTSKPQPSSVVANIISSPARPHFQVSLFLIFFNTVLMARALTGGVSRIAAQVAPHPPPHARRPPGAGIAFGRDVAEEESALMARTLTGGVGCVAQWPTCRQVASALRRGWPLAPPPCSSSPWCHDCVRSCCHCGGVSVDVCMILVFFGGVA